MAGALALAGCTTTSISEIKTREIQDSVFIPGSVSQQIRDCLIENLGRLRKPLETGKLQRRELTFSTEEAGAVFHYMMIEQPGGLKVEARWKNTIADGFNKACACYL